VRVLEIAAAVLLTLGGLRSLWVWSQRRFEGVDVVDHVLYALYLTGRIGLWFAFAGFFVIYASVATPGVPGLEELEPYRWYVLVPLFLGALQLVAGWFLGRREPDAPG
jgi:uncharacterized membrane protein